MRLSLILVFVVTLWPAVGGAQDLTGTWTYRSFTNSEGIYGNNCVARTLRDSWRGQTNEGDPQTIVLTMNGNYINGYEVEDDGSRAGNISGIKNGQAVNFRVMHFPDSPIQSVEIPGCGEWLITGAASAEMGVVMSGTHIHGHFVETIFIRQNDKRRSFRVHAIFAMAKTEP